MSHQVGFQDDEDEEDEVAVGKISYWHLTVHVHGKAINVSCGDATQRLKWLAHVGIGNDTHTFSSCFYLLADKSAF